ncbi:Hpt domain-containing protein [Mucilaginibacter sp. CSA2-8R]|uniref:Hpt domain-containing protein n=1 Tax=Mucilaginibacter sp. CSA2-8R TaxID=3141542 RepID=UPI00315C52C3
MSEIPANTDFDLSFLYEIADGSDEFIVESIDMFTLQTPQLMQEIEQGITTQNWQAAGAAAHKLKPNMGFFGMLNLQSMMQEIESMCKSGAPEQSVLSQKLANAKTIVDSNLIKLAEIKAEKQG